MGQKMSFNEDLIHSMKRMRLNNSSATPIDHKDVAEIRILDIPSPSSPFRKQSAGKYDIMKHAVNAPFENSTTLSSVDEKVVVNTNEYVESVDMPVLDGN
jgi:hypothetical protein